MEKSCVCERGSPVLQPLVSAAAAAGAAVEAAGSGGGQTGEHFVAAWLMQEAASWDWTSSGRPPLKAEQKSRTHSVKITNNSLAEAYCCLERKILTQSNILFYLYLSIYILHTFQ